MMCPRIGSPASPSTGLSPLPAGGSASTLVCHSWASRRFSIAPIPGMVFSVGVNRRRAWSSRYCGVLMVAVIDAPSRALPG